MLIEELTQKINLLEIKSLKLQQENQDLRQVIIKLQEENNKLKERLGLNSKNSSIPSSKELYKAKKEQKKPSGKRQGAQVGHKGHSRVKENPTQIIEVSLESMVCQCGGHIELKQPRIHQKIDIPDIQPNITNYHLARGRCRVCKRRKSASLPEGISEDLLGPKIKSAIAGLTGFYGNSKRKSLAIINNMFGIKISLGTLSHSERRVSEQCQIEYKKIEEQISHASLLNIDETGHQNKDKRSWCWGFFSKDSSLIKLNESRGKKVLEASVFGPDDAIIVTDRYAAYNYFNENNRQICWAHLARDFERFAGSLNPEVKFIGERLSDIAQRLFSLKKDLTDSKITNWKFLKKSKKLRLRSWFYLQKMRYETKSQHAARIAKNIMKVEKMMWKFLEDPSNIPLTNNHAEQQLRQYVCHRKNSYFTQSERGDRFLERMISIYLTLRKQSINPFQVLLDTVKA